MRKNREIRKKMLFYVIFSARSNQAFDKTRDSIFASVGGANCYRTVRRGIKRIKSFFDYLNQNDIEWRILSNPKKHLFWHRILSEIEFPQDAETTPFS